MNSVKNNNKKKKLELLGDCRVQCISFMWMPDADRCVTTVTAGQAEITAFTAASAETLSICSTPAEIFFSFKRVDSIFTEIPSQSRQLPFRSLQHKTAFHKEVGGNGEEGGGRRGVRGTQIESLGPLPGGKQRKESERSLQSRLH